MNDYAKEQLQIPSEKWPEEDWESMDEHDIDDDEVLRVKTWGLPC
jgi:hypothetical protein